MLNFVKSVGIEYNDRLNQIEGGTGAKSFLWVCRGSGPDLLPELSFEVLL